MSGRKLFLQNLDLKQSDSESTNFFLGRSTDAKENPESDFSQLFQGPIDQDLLDNFTKSEPYTAYIVNVSDQYLPYATDEPGDFDEFQEYEIRIESELCGFLSDVEPCDSIPSSPVNDSDLCQAENDCHDNDPEDSSASWKGQLNVCSICNQTFGHRSTLRQHYAAHSGEKPHECSYCKKKFTKKSNLNKHLPIHTGERPYPCDRCDKKFITKAHLQSHYFVHTGVHRYKCDICEAGFQRKSKLLAHYDVHANPDKEAAYSKSREKPSKNKECDVCGKVFATPHKLKMHYRVHTGEKPFQCQECGRRFSLKTMLKSHSYTHTREYPYICYICDKGFRDCTKLKKHFSTYHPEGAK